MDNRLKFHKHAASAVKQANKVLGLIKHSFTTLDDTTLPLLYTSRVRPHLEYGNIIWGPHFKEDMKAVERVHKKSNSDNIKDKRSSIYPKTESFKPSISVIQEREEGGREEGYGDTPRQVCLKTSGHRDV